MARRPQEARGAACYADLHAHTTQSDGRVSPEELVRLAAERGVAVLAVTDHDTLAGVERATRAGAEHGVEIVPGVEVSCDLGGRDLHVLGLFVDPEHSLLEGLLARARAERERTVSRVLRRLSSLGVPVTEAAVRAHAGGDTVGRPHFARALLDAGHVGSVGEAFTRYLAEGRPACVFRARPPVPEACAVIDDAGGVPLVAHPGTYRLDRAAISRLVRLGVRGVEVHHPVHDLDATRRYRAFAEGLGLAVGGGSDFHGGREGASPGTYGVTERELEALRRRRLHPRSATL